MLEGSNKIPINRHEGREEQARDWGVLGRKDREWDRIGQRLGQEEREREIRPEK